MRFLFHPQCRVQRQMQLAADTVWSHKPYTRNNRQHDNIHKSSSKRNRNHKERSITIITRINEIRKRNRLSINQSSITHREDSNDVIWPSVDDIEHLSFCKVIFPTLLLELINTLSCLSTSSSRNQVIKNLTREINNTSILTTILIKKGMGGGNINIISTLYSDGATLARTRARSFEAPLDLRKLSTSKLVSTPELACKLQEFV